MKKAVLFYNPKAGAKTLQHKKLADLIESQDIKCECVSIKEKDWEKFDESVDFLLVAGGDGSIRAVTGALLQRNLMKRQFPLGIIPMGTANNFSKTLGIPQKPEDAVTILNKSVVRKLDVGFVEGLGKTDYFLEGVGVGLFPKLMKKMDKLGDPAGDTVEEKLLETLKVLEEIAENYEGFPISVIADGVKYEGNYLMLEIMNAKSIGPNLMIAENADPGDGEFEVVLIQDKERTKLLNHIRSQIKGKNDGFEYSHLKAKKLVISMPEIDVHVDDKIVKFSGGEIKVYLKNGIIEVLAPGKK